MRNSLTQVGRLPSYAIALGAVAIAFGLTFASWPLLQSTPWALFFVAVLASAWLGGSVPCLIATGGGAVLGRYFFIEPRGTWAMGRESLVPTLVFVGVSLGLNLFAAARRRAESDERAERRRFQATVASIGDGLIASDAEGKVTFLNGIAEELTGWNFREAVGRDLEDVFVIADATTGRPAPNPVREVLKTGRTHGLAHHTYLIARGGEERPIDKSAAPIRDDRGAITGVVLVFRDITRQHEAALALAQSEAFNRRIIESSPDCVKVLDLQGRLLSMSDFGCHLMEIDDFSSWINREWVEFWPAEIRPIALAALEQARNGQIGRFQGCSLTTKGTEKWWDVSVSPILGGGDLPQQLLMISRDVTEKKRVEASLARLHEEESAANGRAIRILESVTDAFFALDRQWRFTYLNPQAEPQLQRSPGELLGKVVWDEFPAAIGTKFEREYRSAMAERRSVTFEEYYPAPIDGWFEVNAYPSEEGLAVYFRNVTDRKRVEARLRASEERYRTLFDLMDEGFCVIEVIFDPAGRPFDYRFLEMNPAFEQQTGLANVIGGTIREFVPGHDDHWFEIYGKVAVTGEAVRIVHEAKALGRWFDVSAFRIGDPASRKVAVLFDDITDRVRAEQGLNEKTERLNLLVENTRDYAVIITDPEGTVIEWQGGAERITGHPAHEVVGHKAHLIFTPEERAEGRPEQEMAKAVEVGRAEDRRWHLKKDGSLFFADGVMTALFDEGGKLRGFGKVFKDATGEQRAEEATRRRAFQFQKLAEIANRINSAHDVRSIIGVVTEEARNLVEAHQAATSMVLELPHLEPVRIVSTSGSSPADRLKAARPGVATPTGPKPGGYLREGEFADAWRGLSPATEPPIEPDAEGGLAAPLVGRNGKSMGLIQLDGKVDGEFTAEDEAILVQLSKLAAIAIENAKLYEELRGNDRRKDEFLAMLAHELRNPLAAISNAVGVTTRSNHPEHLDWSMQVIARQIKHLTRLIDDLLDVSRISRGKIELRRDVLDATPILDSAVATVRPLADERKHTFDVRIDRGNLWVNADPTRLEQVVVNLLNNAAKYSENGGHIELTARRDEADVVIIVKDRGVGIAPEKLPAMFELFAQGDRSLARSEGGLGIGLTIVKKLVEMHGGNIAAASGGVGLGSEFSIRLPAAPQATVAPARAVGSAEAASRKTRILVVDDNMDTARGMVRLLKLLGHEVVTAHDGLGALDLAQEHRPEFILLDIGLPGMDGYEVATRLRREESCKNSLIIAVSGYGQDEDRRRSKEAGFDHHLIKPLDHDDLLSLLMTAGGDRPAG